MATTASTGMPLSFAALGVNILFRSWFLLFVSRVAGSMRTMQTLPFHIDPHIKYIGGNPSLDFLTPSSLPLLNVTIPRGTFLTRVYGIKRTSASYAICVDCSGHDGRYWVVDGRDIPISASVDPNMSCLFSLALEDGPSNESHAFDRRFKLYGEAVVSHVDYILKGSDSGATTAASACETHIRLPGHHNALSRRDDDGDGSSTGTDVGNKMNLVIGLISALITIVVVIAVLAGFYALRLRRKEVQERRRMDTEGGEGNTFKLSDIVKSDSRTLGSTQNIGSEGNTIASQHGQRLEGYSVRKQPKGFPLDQTMSSFSGSTPQTLSMQDSSPLVTTGKGSLGSDRKSGRHKPPSSPPREPIPPTPWSSETLLLTQGLPKGIRENYPSHLPHSSSPIQEKRQASGSRSHSDSDRSGRGHNRNLSSSGSSSQTSHERHIPRKHRPVSKPLPPSPAPSIQPLPDARVIDKSNRYPPSNRLYSTKQLSHRPPMQAIRESSVGSGSSQGTRAKSAEDLRRKNRSQAPGLRGSKSSPELEQPSPSKDIRLRLGENTQPSILRDQDTLRLVSPSGVNEPWGEGGNPRPINPPPHLRLDIRLSGSDFDHVLAPLNDDPPLTDTLEDTRRRRHVGSQRIRGSVTGDDNPLSGRIAVRRVPRAQPPQPPSYEQTPPMPPYRPLPVIEPLSLRPKRALPKPPTRT